MESICKQQFSSLATDSEFDFCSGLVHSTNHLNTWICTDLQSSLKSFSVCNMLSSRIALYLAPVIFPSALTRFHVPTEEKHPYRIMLTAPCFTLGTVCSG
ncbi:hypothetical protein AMECASPLE_016253 [Ameca splendens]|uniref:Uncharacterized protein n=1 Tax=Ameca splendens TaxID=208324 RepID=A0ABV1A9K9_9TELE